MITRFQLVPPGSSLWIWRCNGGRDGFFGQRIVRGRAVWFGSDAVMQRTLTIRPHQAKRRKQPNATRAAA